MNGARGFTLVEVLVSMALIAVGLAAVATMGLTSTARVDRSGERTVALTIGQQRIEHLRNLPWSDIELNAGSSYGAMGGIYAGYSLKTEIVDDVPEAGLKQVTVVAATPSGRQVELVSLLVEQDE